MDKTALNVIAKNYCTNILYVCKRCTLSYVNEGKAWYANTYFICSELANKFNVSISLVAGVIAALSPGMKWYQNLIAAQQLLESYQSGVPLENIPSRGIYGKRNFAKAIKIVCGDEPFQVLGGNKVRAFYNCISHKFSNEAPTVVLDRHAVSIAVGQNLSDKYITYVSTDKRYQLLANAYISVANRLGMEPHHLQAMVWCRWRDFWYAGT